MVYVSTAQSRIVGHLGLILVLCFTFYFILSSWRKREEGEGSNIRKAMGEGVETEEEEFIFQSPSITV